MPRLANLTTLLHPALFAVLSATAACTASSPGGGGVYLTSAGTPCQPGPDICGVAGNDSARLHCEAGSWTPLDVCPLGTYCTGTPSGGFTCAAGTSPSADGAGSADSGTRLGDGQGGGSGQEDGAGQGADSAADAAPPVPDGSGPLDAVQDAKADSVASPDIGPPDTGTSTGPDAKTDTKTDAQTQPCGGACDFGTKCNTLTNKCYVPCGGPCPGGAVCDESQGPPGKCPAVTNPGGFGVDGNSKGVQKMTALAIAPSGVGCDLSGDGKPDNALATLGSLVGSQVQDAVTSGSLVILLDPKSWSTSGSAFVVHLLTGSMDSGSCSPTSAGCSYWVSPSSYDVSGGCTPPACPPQVAFSNAVVSGGSKLSMSAPKYTLNLDMGTAPLALNISKVQVTGTVANANEWTTTTGGMLCGAISDTDLLAAIDAAPDSAFASFGGKAQVKALLPMLLKKDVSLSGGAIDAYSIALNFETKSGTVLGVEP